MSSQQPFFIALVYLHKRLEQISFENGEKEEGDRYTVISSDTSKRKRISIPANISIERTVSIVQDKENPMFARLVVWNNSNSEYHLSKKDAQILFNRMCLADSINGPAFKIIQFSQFKYFVVVNLSLIKVPFDFVNLNRLYLPSQKLQPTQSSVENKSLNETQKSDQCSEDKLNHELSKRIEELNTLFKKLNDDSKLMQRRDQEVMRLLLQGMDQFFAALETLDVKAVSELLQTGMGMKSRNTQGQTPLHVAAANDNLEMVEFLVLNGAELLAVDNNNKTPLDLAKNEKIQEFLKSSLEKNGTLQQTSGSVSVPSEQKKNR